jgi:hypothetical protein
LSCCIDYSLNRNKIASFANVFARIRNKMMARFRDTFRSSINNMALVACRFVPNWGQNVVENLESSVDVPRHLCDCLKLAADYDTCQFTEVQRFQHDSRTTSPPTD